ncbi:MAG TPA: 3,4-dihydroxy-2-butanone-4-phosphate synthase [Solirubrobacteraceae bacterium]|nr:3,4-dihydroxy-2-butanone-4-phosphate synthase [Solirubrobacteraceae bacterium]
MRTGNRRPNPFSSIESALQDMRAGKMVVVCDAEDRENEGDLTIAAQFAGPQAINFMATHGRGLICLALTAERCAQLRLRQMVQENESHHGTAFTVSVEARSGVTTGISTYDRARTVEVAIDPRSGPSDLVSPGHMFPLRARPAGVLERTGQTEAAVDLARLAGLYPAGVICEIMNDDGTMARVGDLERYCAVHGLRMVSIADLIAYRRARERFIERVVETTLPTRHGMFRAIGYRSRTSERDHVALVKGEVRGFDDILVRIHRECPTGDVFGSLRSTADLPMEDAMRRVESEGTGVVLYLAGDDRAGSLLEGLRIEQLRELGVETTELGRAAGLPADAGDYGAAAEILADLGVSSVRVLTADAAEPSALKSHGIAVSGQVPIVRSVQEPPVDLLPPRSRRLEHVLRAYDLGFMSVEVDEAAG